VGQRLGMGHGSSLQNPYHFIIHICATCESGYLSQYYDYAPGWTTGVRFQSGAGNSSHRHRVQTGSEVHPASYPVGIPLVVKRPVRKADDSHTSSARSYTSTPPYAFMTWCAVKKRVCAEGMIQS
jgi:hypothetical protein